MAERSGFFNALLVEGEYDRKYNANDYCENLATIISNGVLRSENDDLKVTSSGLVVSVNTGRGWINGHWYVNDAAFAFPAITAPTSGNRWDRVMLRFDDSTSGRKISLEYVQGTAAATPSKPAPTRTNSVYDLVLADIYVATNATTLQITDTRDNPELCGWIYSTSGDDSFFTSLDNDFNTWFQATKNNLSSVTLFKRYNWRTVIATAGNTVTFSIPQYDADTCFIEVFVNGILETAGTDYTLNNSTLTFSGTLTAGTEVEVKCYKSIDGTGIMTVADEITALQNAYNTLAGMNKYTYYCTGSNDNIALSQIAAAIYAGSYTVGSLSQAAEAFLSTLGGNTFLAALPEDAQITIDVVGKLGATTPYAGTGTADQRYRWFSLGLTTVNAKKLIFDFAKCEKISITPAANTSNIIFFGTDINIRNAYVDVTTTANNCNVVMIVGSNVFGITNAENCHFIIRTTGTAVIAHTGTFVNCIFHVKSLNDNAYCIDGKQAGICRLIGGTLSAYVGTGATNKISCVFNFDAISSGTIMAYNIYAPITAQTGYKQSWLCRSMGAMTYINGVISTLQSTGGASYKIINGQV